VIGKALRVGMRRRQRRYLGVLAAAVFLPLVLVAAGCGGGHEGDDEEERPVSAPPRVAIQAGETIVTLDRDALARSGLVVEALRATSQQAEETAYGSVLDLTELADARGAWTATAERVAKAQAALMASRAEFQRIKVLHSDERIVSDKDLDVATAAFRADEAELRAAEGALEAQRAVARQRWGGLIAGWLEQGSLQLDALLQQKERLVQLTLPPDSPLPSPPAKATLHLTGGATVEARLVSLAPKTDPRIQGESLFYAALATPALPPGATVRGILSRGEHMVGVVVPAPAVVWLQGRAWVYVEKAPGQFVRREVPADTPLAEGWFVAKNLTAGERVVVQGAQTLLSEEGRAAVHGSEG
jgi:hypothetical protein